MTTKLDANTKRLRELGWKPPKISSYEPLSLVTHIGKKKIGGKK